MQHAPSLFPEPLLLLIQMGIFFASWLVLHTLVFKPYMALLKARREKTVGLLEKATKAKARAVQLQTDYETFMKAERKKIVAWTDDERKRISDDERQIVSEARDSVAKELQSVRAKISADCEKARRDLLPQIADYSSQIVSKLVGYSVKVTPTPEMKKSIEAEPAVRG